MTLKPKDAEALTALTEARWRAEDDALIARRAQYAATRTAVKNGASLREVAELTGMSHQMVHKLVTPPPERKRGPA